MINIIRNIKKIKQLEERISELEYALVNLEMATGHQTFRTLKDSRYESPSDLAYMKERGFI